MNDVLGTLPSEALDQEFAAVARHLKRERPVHEEAVSSRVPSSPNLKQRLHPPTEHDYWGVAPCIIRECEPLTSENNHACDESRQCALQRTDIGMNDEH
ncbi:hypothetical protein ACLEPN_11235 [Myxococcus sp. 1LA]